MRVLGWLLLGWLLERQSLCSDDATDPLMPDVANGPNQRTVFMVRSRKDGRWLRGAKYWPWTKHRQLAAVHDSPGVFSMLLFRYESQEPEILRFTTTTLIQQHTPRPGER